MHGAASLVCGTVKMKNANGTESTEASSAGV